MYQISITFNFCFVHIQAVGFSVNLVSMEVTFLVCGVIFGVIVKWRVWDCAITVTVLHILMSCLGKIYFILLIVELYTLSFIVRIPGR